MTDFRALYDKAWAAGVAAATSVKPRPMHVMDGFSNRHVETVPDGVCGFAWLRFKGNSAFAKWCKTQSDIRLGDGYPNGKTIWIGDYNQSMTRKEAHANAMASVLNDAGVDCRSESRMD